LFAGSELALVSLREGQLRRLEGQGGNGPVLARLARDPNRFLATIQIGITLAGFLASASAAVSLAKPLQARLSLFGEAAEAVAIVAVTVMLSYLTLVFGELAPKRVAMQRAERWGLFVARPLAALSVIARPAVWVLSSSADLAVRLLGGDPSRQREDVTEEEIRDLLAAQTTFNDQQRTIISGAFEVADRTLRDVLRPRSDVVLLDASVSAADGLAILITSGHSRAPVADNGDLDEVRGVVHLRDLVGGVGLAGQHARPPLFFPESITVLEALRQMQVGHEQMAIIVSEHGGAEGIVTLEDLIEELVGEIYDETDPDVLSARWLADGSVVIPGRFPIHDLADIGVELPEGDYATVAGLLLKVAGRIPLEGEIIELEGWTATVLAVEHHAVTSVQLSSSSRRHNHRRP
jgi:putative hemolysin